MDNVRKDFDERYLIWTALTRATWQSCSTRNQMRTLTLRRSNVVFASTSSEFWPRISRKGYEIESLSQQMANIKLHVVCQNMLSILIYDISERSKVMIRNLRSWITRKRCERESSCQQTTNRKWYVADRMALLIWPLVTLEGQIEVNFWKTGFLCEIAL